MDWRLRNAPLIQSAMEDLLDDLMIGLSDHGASLDGNLQSNAMNLPTSPSIIGDTLDQLFRLTRSVRRSGVLRRFVKITDFTEYSVEEVNISEQFKSAASTLILHYYLKETRTSDELKNRLIRTICLRHKRFSYLKARKGQLPGKPAIPARACPPRKKQTIESHSAYRAQPSVMTATTIQFDHVPAKYSVQASTSKEPEIITSHFELPRPPFVEVGRKEAECPYCLLVCPVKDFSGDNWIKHILEDFMPYICILDSCPTPDTLFHSTKDWLHHMKHEHVVNSWSCVDNRSHTSSFYFDSASEFKLHMHQCHQMSFDEADLDLITDACFEAKARDMSLEDCPFCDKCPSIDFPPEHWIQHVAQHLFAFARISLQGYLEEDDEESDISGSQNEKGSTSHQFISPTITDGLLDPSFESQDDGLDHLYMLNSLEEVPDTDDIMWTDYFGLMQEPKGGLATDPILEVFIERAEELCKIQGSSRTIAGGSSRSPGRQVLPPVQNLPLFSQTLQRVITTEIFYLNKIGLFRSLYQKRLSQSTNEPPRLRKFISDVLNNLDAVKMVNEDNVLLPLQNHPGAHEVSEIFLTWNSRANLIYTDYISRSPRAIQVVRTEADKNPGYRAFFDKSHWTHDLEAYLDLPLARMQEYKSLLSTINPTALEDDYQKSRFVSAMKALDLAALQYDSSMKQARMVLDLLDEFDGKIPEDFRFILTQDSIGKMGLDFDEDRGNSPSEACSHDTFKNTSMDEGLPNGRSSDSVLLGFMSNSIADTHGDQKTQTSSPRNFKKLPGVMEPQ
ncbi:hypothetical protein N7454_004464 [Penicillium verhagenii]|nr:hypothetical protein N7454_004464 [Penicillium verhagenii]